MNNSQFVFSRLTITCLVLCLSLVITSSSLAAEYVSVTKNKVNVRSGPNTNDPIRWEVFKSFPLEVVKRDNEWINCQDFEGDKGWIHSDMVVSKKTVIVKKKKINLRNIPSTGKDSKIVAVVKYGVVFDAIGKDGEWLQVKHKDGSGGWVHQGLVWPSDPFD